MLDAACLQVGPQLRHLGKQCLVPDERLGRLPGPNDARIHGRITGIHIMRLPVVRVIVQPRELGTTEGQGRLKTIRDMLKAQGTAGALDALEHLALAGAVARNGADQVVLPAVHGGVRPPVVSGITRRSRGYCRGLTRPWMSGTLLR